GREVGRGAGDAEAPARLAESRAAPDELQRRREAAEGELTELQAKALAAQAELEAQTERARDAAAAPPAEAVEPVRESRPIATLLLVAFLLGALAMGVTYLLFHP